MKIDLPDDAPEADLVFDCNKKTKLDILNGALDFSREKMTLV
jgi:hypothetical protein